MKASLAAVVLALAAGAGEILIRPQEKAVPLPGGSAGLRLDDYYFDRTLGRLVVPAGGSGRLDFVDPETGSAEALAGFAAPARAASRGGPTSADGEAGTIYVTDRTDRRVYVVDGRRRAIVSSAALAGEPDYVRWVGPTREVWVTEPRERRIEIFSSSATLRHEAFLAVPDGVEALEVDAARGRAYTNSGSRTLAIDLKARKVAARWVHRCRRAQGLALDEARGFLIVACGEGRAVVLDAKDDGRALSDLLFGDGLDIIAFSPGTSRVFLPAARSATLGFAGLSDEGKLAMLGQVQTARGAHCVAADERGGAWVCDPERGRLLRITDALAAGLKTRY